MQKASNTYDAQDRRKRTLGWAHTDESTREYDKKQRGRMGRDARQTDRNYNRYKKFFGKGKAPMAKSLDEIKDSFEDAVEKVLNSDDSQMEKVAAVSVLVTALEKAVMSSEEV